MWITRWISAIAGLVLIGVSAVPASPPPAGLPAEVAMPASAVEVPSLRTQFSRTFTLGDGRMIAEISSAPIHFANPGGEWLPFDADTTDSMFPQVASYWTGHIQNQNSSGIIKNDNDIYFRGGHSASQDKRQGWVKFDLTAIPDSGTVNATGMVYYCYSVDPNGGPTTAITRVTSNPVAAAAATLWTEITTGTVCCIASAHGGGWVLRPLNSNGVAAVRACVTQNWVAFGLYEPESDNNRWGHAYGYYPRSTAPRLYVTYTPPPPKPDVGIKQITAPAGSYDTGSMVNPVAVWHNYHTASYSFTAYAFLINPSGVRVYSDSRVLASVGAGRDTSITFTGYNVGPVSGNWTVRCSTYAFGDTTRSNDVRQQTFRVTPRYADVGVRSIVAPTGTCDTGSTTQPTAIWRNFGSAPVNFGAWFVLINPGGSRVYTQQIAVAGLLSGADTSLVFPSYDFGSVQGTWTARCSTACPIDTAPANNVLQQTFTVAPWSTHADVGAKVIVTPSGCLDTGASAAPSATWHNYYSTPATFDAFMILRNPAGSRVYSRSIHVTGLGGDGDTTLAFPSFRVDTSQGQWGVRCSTGMAFDTCLQNNVLDGGFMVYIGGRVPWPYGWVEVGSMPVEPSGKAVKQGGWFAFMAGNGTFYGLKGNNTGDFYSYNPMTDVWSKRKLLPPGLSGKMPKKGAVGCTDGTRYVYATKGNNTLEFWRYDAGGDSWQRMADVLAQLSGKRVKGGTGVVHATVGDTGYVYLLKGYKSDFLRFNTAANRWDVMSSAPIAAHPKWDRGSWIVHDGNNAIYAHKAKYHELWKYDISTDSWATQLNGMPYVRMTGGRSKKSKDGGCAAWSDDAIYAFKGGNTNEYWRYSAAGDTWVGLESLPPQGSSGRLRKVKDGGSIAAFGQGAFFALKGNNTRELWRYRMAPLPQGGTPGGSLVGAVVPTQSHHGLRVSPNPTAPGRVSVSYALPGSGFARLAVYNIAGRLLHAAGMRCSQQGVAYLDLSRFSPGVYAVRLESGSGSYTTKLVVR